MRVRRESLILMDGLLSVEVSPMARSSRVILVATLIVALIAPALPAIAQQGTAPAGPPPTIGGEIIGRAEGGPTVQAERLQVLPSTGTELTLYALLAAGTILAGAGLVIAARRRRSPTSGPATAKVE